MAGMPKKEVFVSAEYAPERASTITSALLLSWAINAPARLKASRIEPSTYFES